VCCYVKMVAEREREYMEKEKEVSQYLNLNFLQLNCEVILIHILIHISITYFIIDISLFFKIFSLLFSSLIMTT